MFINVFAGSSSICYLLFLVNQCPPPHALACFVFHVFVDPTSFWVNLVSVEFTVPVSHSLQLGFTLKKRWDL